MSSSGSGRRPSLAQTTRLVARALGLSAEALTAGCRPAIQDDLPAILALRRQVIGQHIGWDDTAYLTWRYRLGRPQGGGDCWVLVHDGQLLGMVGTQDLVLHCGGESRPGMSLMDILIQPELDGVGLGVWLNLFIQAQTTVTLAIGANANSIGMVSRLFDALPNRRSYVHPVRLGRFLRKRLPVPGFASLIAPGLEAAMRLGRALLLVPKWPSSSALQIRPLTPLDGDTLAALDQQLRDGPQVHTERTSSGLNWRLFDNPRGPCQAWGAWSAGRLLGYVATRLMPQEDGGLALTVLDLAVPLPGGRAALRALLWRVLEEAWRQDVDYVSITAYHHGLERELRRAGFRQQAHPYEIVGLTCRDEQFKQLVEARHDWTLSEVHTDRL